MVLTLRKPTLLCSRLSEIQTTLLVSFLEPNTSLLANVVIRMLLYDLWSPEIPSLTKSIQA